MLSAREVEERGEREEACEKNARWTRLRILAILRKPSHLLLLEGIPQAVVDGPR